MKKPKVSLSFFLLVFFVPLFLSVPGLSQEPEPSDYLYWTNHSNVIGKACLDLGEFYPFFIQELPGPVGIAINEKYIYWANFSYYLGTTIGRANLDGTGTKLDFISGCSRPWGVAVDDTYIYWTNIEPYNQIGRANLDGTNANQSFIQLGWPARGVISRGDYIYWTNYSGNSIGRANLDGSDVNEFWIISCTHNPHCIAFTESHIYWTNYDTGSIGRANIDGTGAEFWLDLGLTQPVGIAIKGDSLFWGEHGAGNIGWAKLDKSSFNKYWITGYGGTCIAITPERSKRYTFEGFFSPIDNIPTVNKANAGQTIPVKWRLTDKNGLPISDPASFSSIKSSPVNCATYVGDPINYVDEPAAGSSGLQYLGDGWWQYNWKTSKAYKGQCRTMKLTLDDHSEHTASFSFK
jgi:hypothetical protein